MGHCSLPSSSTRNNANGRWQMAAKVQAAAAADGAAACADSTSSHPADAPFCPFRNIKYFVRSTHDLQTETHDDRPTDRQRWE